MLPRYPELASKRLVITGSASGLGRAMAQAFIEQDCQLALLDRDLQPSRENLKSERDCLLLRVDVSDPVALRSAFDAAAAQMGGLDIVFANAGIAAGPGFRDLTGNAVSEGALESIAVELWERVIAVNLTGVFNTLQCAVPHLKRGGGGKVVVTTSIASRTTEDWVGTPYMPAKAGVAHLVRQAALELGPFGITVNAIAPGFFPTNLGCGRKPTPGFMEAMRERIPLGRTGCMADIQALALYLASAGSDFISGTEITIDGGASLR